VRKAIERLRIYPKLPVDAACNLVLPQLEAKYAVDDRTERDNDALENLQTLRVIGKDFRTAEEFTQYALKMMHRRNDPRGVTVSTVHQAKGGEWRNVFVVGVKANGIPHKNGDPTEERRIYFTAISRAKDFLRISFSGTPSPYLRKYITEDILDVLREKAKEVERLQQPGLFA
jgi:superfamily I DNA/RNA helicase